MESLPPMPAETANLAEPTAEAPGKPQDAPEAVSAPTPLPDPAEAVSDALANPESTPAPSPSVEPPAPKVVRIPMPEAPQHALEAQAKAAAAAVMATWEVLPGAPEHPVWVEGHGKYRGRAHGIGACGGGPVVSTLCHQCPKANLNGGQRSCTGSVCLETLQDPNFVVCPDFPKRLCGPRY